MSQMTEGIHRWVDSLSVSPGTKKILHVVLPLVPWVVLAIVLIIVVRAL